MIEKFNKRCIKPLVAALSLAPVIAFSSMIAGTLVQTPDGPRAIETLKVGELVLAYNESGNTITVQPITLLLTGVVDEVMTIEIVHADGRVISIGATQEHPFYVGQKNAAGVLEYSWQPMQSLNSGDALFTDAGASADILQVKEHKLSQRVFNIEVAHQHNYFVSEYKVLVHNPNEECSPSELLKEFDNAFNIVAPNRGIRPGKRYSRILSQFNLHPEIRAHARFNEFEGKRDAGISSAYWQYYSFDNMPSKADDDFVYADCGLQCALLGQFLSDKGTSDLESRYFHVLALHPEIYPNHQFALFFKRPENAVFEAVINGPYKVSVKDASTWLDGISKIDEFAIFNPWADSRARVFEGDFKPSEAIQEIFDEYYATGTERPRLEHMVLRSYRGTFRSPR